MIPGSDYIHITILLAQQNDLECMAELEAIHRANPHPITPNQRLSIALVRKYIESKNPNSMKRTYSQNNRLHGLLRQLGLDLDTKEDLVKQFTNKRTKRSSKMNVHECDNLIRHLEKLVGSSAVLDRKRKRVIANLAEAGYITGDGKPDMLKIYDWVCRQKFKKRLNDHTAEELSSLIHAAEQLKKHYISKYQTA